MENSDSPIVIEPPGKAQYCVIWLHGLGADGHDFAGIQDALNLPADHGVRFVFPHAPLRPVSINNGYIMRAWYDIFGLQADSPQDEAGLGQAESYVLDLVAGQLGQGIPERHIVIAGFSQGGSVALLTALRHGRPFAGVVALSTWLPLAQQVMTQRQSGDYRQFPIFMAHGDADGVVPTAFGRISCERLQQMDLTVDWHTYPMAHSVCDEEVVDLGLWLRRVLDLSS